jgi:hypothetical protein
MVGILICALEAVIDEGIQIIQCLLIGRNAHRRIVIFWDRAGKEMVTRSQSRYARDKRSRLSMTPGEPGFRSFE